MTAYVLVHGAWGGSYSWREFAPLLRARGHEVFIPSLTLSTDNAAMIGAAGFRQLRAGKVGSLDFNAEASLIL